MREVVFPVVSEQTSRDLVQEAKATGPIDRTTLRPVIRNSHEGHYRRMAPQASGPWISARTTDAIARWSGPSTS